MEDPVILLRCELSLGRVGLKIMILTFLFFFLCPDGSHSDARKEISQNDLIGLRMLNPNGTKFQYVGVLWNSWRP